MKYIAIDGRGGSGKTHLANTLGKKLNTFVLHLDDFGNDYEPFIGIPKLVDTLLEADKKFVIFEGVGVFDERFDHFNPFRIFVNTSPDVRRDRALSRDVPTSDRSAEEWARIYEIWREAEGKYFTDEILRKADLMSDENGNINIEETIELLATQSD